MQLPLARTQGAARAAAPHIHAGFSRELALATHAAA